MKWYFKCLREASDFYSRASRKEFWMFNFFSILLFIVLGIIDHIMGFTIDDAQVIGPLVITYSICITKPSYAVLVRRLHDVGRNGWSFFIFLIPIFGLIILLIWLCKKSELKENEWGKNPAEEQ
ncbi:MAG: DUF805 domain-containing protein [Bacteroidales bacterium]|nr:DUF805 domain-containing protein [Bacteroidales bacterium]